MAGDAADVAREAGAGLVCPPEDPAALAQAVRELYAMPAEQREGMGQAGRKVFLANPITDGTGTFGNVVLRRFLESDFNEIRVFSRDEKKQHDRRLAYNNKKLKFYIGDV